MAIYKFIKLPRQRSSTFDFARPSSTIAHKGSEASGLGWPSLFLLLVKSKNKDIYIKKEVQGWEPRP